jgi:TonB family protein
LANQRSDLPREFAAKRAEVLSDSTELDDLLRAILGDEGAPAPVEGRLRQAVEARPVPTVVARLEPTLVAPPRVATRPDWDIGRSDVTEEEDADTAWANNLKGFLGEVRRQDVRAIAPELTAAEPVYPIPSPVLPRTWRDVIPVPTSKQSLLIAGLSAAALIVLSASILRDDQDYRVVPASPAPAVPTLVPPAAAVEPPTSAVPPVPANIEVTAPAAETTAKPRVIAPPSPVRASEPVQPRNLPSPAAAPVAAPPAVVQRVVDEPVTAPARTAIPDSDPPRPADSAPAPAAAAPAVAGGAEPVAPTSVASVPASVARRTPPRLLTGGAPEYPAALRTARVGGSVEVRFTIDSSGRAINVQAVTGPAQLRPIAEATVRRWRYEPAHLGTVAVDTQTSVNFNFDPSTRRPQD